MTRATDGGETGIDDPEPQQRYPFTLKSLRLFTVRASSRLLAIGYRPFGLGFSLLT